MGVVLKDLFKIINCADCFNVHAPQYSLQLHITIYYCHILLLHYTVSETCIVNPEPSCF